MNAFKTPEEGFAFLRRKLDGIKRGTTDAWVRQEAETALLAVDALSQGTEASGTPAHSKASVPASPDAKERDA